MFEKSYHFILTLFVLSFGLQLLADNKPARAANPPTFLTTVGDRLMLGGKIITLKGTNFYPLHQSYAAMWEQWDAENVRESLRQVALLGNNCVRILVPFGEEHGWTKPGDGAVSQEQLDLIRQFLQIASEFGLRAIVTLFDFEDLAEPNSRAENEHRRYADSIVRAFRDDDRILAWDLHNEPDNYGVWASANQPEPSLTWLSRMRQYVRERDPNHLITIGLGRRESYFRKNAGGLNVIDMVDFIAYHSYNADALAEEIYELQEVTNRKKPIILEETGWPSGPSFATDYNETIQLAKYEKTLKIAQDHNVSGVLQWQFFDSEPNSAPAWDDYSLYYGLVRRNGSLKPAAYLWHTGYPADKLMLASVASNLGLTKRAPPLNPPHYFPQTDHYIGTPFWELWRRTYEADVIGYPLTEVFIVDDIGGGRHNFNDDQGRIPVYQYYENLRLEYHPERRTSPDFAALTGLDRYMFLIEIGKIGLEMAAIRGYRFQTGNQSEPDSYTHQWFTQTNQALKEPFLSYWRNHIGNYMFGSPISQPFEEIDPTTGLSHTVQYFEKGRLEIADGVVRVGKVAQEILQAKGWLKPLSGFDHPAFSAVWQRTDHLVANNKASRSWLWGDKPFATIEEAYQEALGGTRLVQYFDKSRMEITAPFGATDVKGYVTNGLLVREMISGNVQVGNDKFEKRLPADVPLAGDPAALNNLAPTYQSLQNHLSSQPDRSGQIIDKQLQKDGTLTTVEATLAKQATLSHYTNDHNIASVFWNYLTQTRGPVIEAGQIVTGDVVDWLFSVGLPISEPYWTRSKVGGVEKAVLVQAFERRILTYTPTNDPDFQVEMGNVGQHYYAWRYNR